MSTPRSKPTRRRTVHDLHVTTAPLKARIGDSPPVTTFDVTLADRIRSEFLEMRGFSPTLEQAERLFHLPEEVCRTMLARLVEEGFLRIEHDGRFRLLRHG